LLIIHFTNQKSSSHINVQITKWKMFYLLIINLQMIMETNRLYLSSKDA